MNKDSIIDEVIIERDRQDRLWGLQDNLTLDRWYTILGEEVGELAEAILELPSQEDDTYPKAMRHLQTEAIQVAAVIFALLEFAT